MQQPGSNGANAKVKTQDSLNPQQDSLNPQPCNLHLVFNLSQAQRQNRLADGRAKM